MTFALVDCNSFYASCERIFRPDIKKRPVVVLSNNDGCVVALSKEAKQLGIKMCEPWFKIEKSFLKKGGVAFSSNYELYADVSSRVMQTLEYLAPEVKEQMNPDDTYVFNGPQNRFLAGQPIPVVYGEVRLGGLPINIQTVGQPFDGVETEIDSQGNIYLSRA